MGRRTYGLLLVLCWLTASLGAQQDTVVTRVYESLVAEDGLHFAGKRGVDYQFGAQISAHGDCIKVVNGYIGSRHLLTRVDGRTVHYWRAGEEGELQSAVGGDIPAGGAKLFALGNTLVTIDLDDGRPRIKTAPAGTNDWKTVYTDRSGSRCFRHFRAELAGDSLYAYLMERAEGDARPLYLQAYDISGLRAESLLDGLERGFIAPAGKAQPHIQYHAVTQQLLPRLPRELIIKPTD